MHHKPFIAFIQSLCKPSKLHNLLTDKSLPSLLAYTLNHTNVFKHGSGLLHPSSMAHRPPVYIYCTYMQDKLKSFALFQMPPFFKILPMLAEMTPVNKPLKLLNKFLNVFCYIQLFNCPINIKEHT